MSMGAVNLRDFRSCLGAMRSSDAEDGDSSGYSMWFSAGVCFCSVFLGWVAFIVGAVFAVFHCWII